MNRYYKIAGLAILGLLMVGVAEAATVALATSSWQHSATARQPNALSMSAKSPTNVSVTGGAASNITLTGTAACVRIDCGTVDALYVVSASSVATAATSTVGNNLFAQSVEKFCLPVGKNYISVYAASNTTCKVAELDTP